MRVSIGRASRLIVALASVAFVAGVDAAPPPTYLAGFLNTGSAFEVVLVDPTAPASVTVLHSRPGAMLLPFGQKISGAFNPPYAYTDRHYSQVFYPKDNRIYKASLLRPGTPTPVQVSSEAAADPMCSLDYAVDEPQPWFIYHLAGPDGQCLLGDDQFKVAHLEMGPGDAAGAGRFPVARISDTALRTTGWLALDGNALRHYDAAFGNPTTIATFAEDVVHVGQTFSGPSIFLLRIDHDLYAYNTGTRTLSPSLYRFSGDFIRYTAGIDDGTTTYFTEGSVDLMTGASTYKVSRIASDGSGAPVQVAAGAGSASLSLTATRVIVEVNGAALDRMFEVLSIPRAGGAAVVLFTGGLEAIGSRVVTVSERTVYANIVGASGSTLDAVRVRDDGTNRVTIPSASWIGHTHPETCSGVLACDWPQYLLRVEGPGISLTSTPGTLKSFSAATETDVATLGTLPPDRVFGFYQQAFGSRGLFNGTALAPSSIIDLYYFDATVAGSLVAVRSTGSAPTSPVTVVEYFNQSLDHYFVTWVAAEIAKLDAGVEIRGWVRTGRTFKTYTSAQPGTSPVCRYYIPPGLGDSHFYGRGTAECDATGQNNPGFTLEDPNFMHMFLPVAGACPANTNPVYRVFSNRSDANHRYMIDKAVRDQMVALGWLAEGDGPDLVVMCAPVGS